MKTNKPAVYDTRFLTESYSPKMKYYLQKQEMKRAEEKDMFQRLLSMSCIVLLLLLTGVKLQKIK